MILFDLLATPHFSMSVPCVALMSELCYVLSRIGWLSILCYTVWCCTGLITINLSGLCCIQYRVFPVKTPVFVLTLQWVAKPLCTYRLYCVPYCVVYLRTKDRGMISSVHGCVMYISF
jgi:hypothetical protein